MLQIKMNTIDGIGRKKVSDDAGALLRRCRLKNLRYCMGFLYISVWEVQVI
ncbi:MAG: hypothetical protein IKN04_01445 [Clostridia bacterium]|nr:hypothetical protein [Clostridia bacterium]